MAEGEKATPEEAREALDAIVHKEVSAAWYSLKEQMSRGAPRVTYRTDYNPKASSAYFLAAMFGPELGFGSPKECLLFRDEHYPQGFYNIFVRTVMQAFPGYKPASARMGDIVFTKEESRQPAQPA